MGFKTIIAIIPDNEGAETALDQAILKIMKAHKAEGHHLFKALDTPLPEAEKPKRKRRTKEEIYSDEQEAKTADSSKD